MSTTTRDDVFRKLTFGTRFSRTEKRRYTNIGVSKTDASSQPMPIGGLPEELDFFKTTNNITTLNNINTDAEKTNAAVGRKLGNSLKIPKKPIFKTKAEQYAFCSRKKIKVYGSDAPPPIKKFIDLARPELGVSLELIKTIQEAGLKRPTPVQLQSLPVLLSGRDAFIVAPTGSGKTLVFAVTLLTLLARQYELVDSQPQPGRIQAIVLAPTRELALQIRDEFRKFTPSLNSSEDALPSSQRLKTVLLNRAVLSSWQINPPAKFPAILVSTPLRLVQAIETKAVDLSNVRHIILDEGDRLLESGLMEQLDDILAACHKGDHTIQKVLLSATIPAGVEDLARTFMSDDDPLRVVIGTPNAANQAIDQRLVYVGQEEGKLMAIRQLLVEGIEPPVIIFTETIERATALFRELVHHGITVDMIHGDRTQAERERIVAQFRAGRLWFLITTDLLARGLDFPEVACVINYDFPLTTASYIHRIGRTGRAGKRGKAITLFTKDDGDALKVVANVMRQSGCEVPEWMLQLKRNSTRAILRNRKLRRRQQGHNDREK